MVKQLPITEYAALIQETIDKHPVTIIAGSTGSGKTTQLPQYCLKMGRGLNGIIGHTQPRRLAARTVAERIAEETQTSLGSMVGYQIRFTDKSAEDTRIKVMTDGILLAQMVADPLLKAYDTLIIDEAHERSLNIDFILGYIKQLLPKRRDLKVIITSATIDLQSFSRHFNEAPIIQVSGQLYPVSVRYLSLEEASDSSMTLSDRILKVIHSIPFYPRGDVLVFLPGERDIVETEEVLNGAALKETEVFPLYGRLSMEKQKGIFKPSIGRRIILSTNVAETSVTVPNIRYVIDTGLARISRYNPRLKVQQLPIEPISQASAEQRKGRCGRLSEGVCYRLYTEEDYIKRPLYTDPEILRTNLAQVLLKMADLRLGPASAFPFLSAPKLKHIQDGVQLLKLLGAFHEEGSLSPLGKKMARLPFDPRLSRVLWAAERHHCWQEMIIIVAFLSTQDPRERPLDQQEASKAQHRSFADSASDFMSIIKLHTMLLEQKATLSRKAFQQYCVLKFLSYRRVCEWWDIQEQIRELVGEIKLNPSPATYLQIHQALLTGLFDCVGCLQEEGSYLGPRGIQFYVFPGSWVSSKPKWVVTFGWMQTTRLFAPMVAKVEPEWIEQAGRSLVKRQYENPHWQSKRGTVGAYEHVTLLGLTLISGRLVNYGPLDPSLSRELFIMEGLVAGAVPEKFAFLDYNNGLCAEVEAIEHRVREKDILITESQMADFYKSQIPEDIYDWVGFKGWLKTIDQKTLFFNQSDLLQKDPSKLLEAYPTHMVIKGVRFALRYRFEPGHPEDGVSLELPEAARRQFSTRDFDWLVKGLLEEKIVALIKGLPKPFRRSFTPPTFFAKSVLACDLNRNDDFRNTLSRELERMTGVSIPENLWDFEKLPSHCLMRFEIIDEKGRVIESTRCLEQSQVPAIISKSVVESPVNDFPEGAFLLPITEMKQGFSITYYIALVEEKGEVWVKRFDDQQKALLAHEKGVAELLYQQLSSSIKLSIKAMPLLKKVLMHDTLCGSTESCVKALWLGVYYLSAPVSFQDIRTKTEYVELKQSLKLRIRDQMQSLIHLLADILQEAEQSLVLLKKHQKNLSLITYNSIQSQWNQLFFPHFWVGVPSKWLNRYKVYAEAMKIRIEKALIDPKKDEILWKSIAAFKREDEGRFLIEECKIMLFAEKLKTIQPISPQRLEKLWAKK